MLPWSIDPSFASLPVGIQLLAFIWTHHAETAELLNREVVEKKIDSF